MAIERFLPQFGHLPVLGILGFGPPQGWPMGLRDAEDGYCYLDSQFAKKL